VAQKIKRLVEQLAIFLKQRELKRVAKIFSKNGILLLEFILCKCKIDINYLLLIERLSTQMIIITSIAGGSIDFIFSWFSVGTSLVVPTLLISILSIRSVG
jgi:hypothetical protein